MPQKITFRAKWNSWVLVESGEQLYEVYHKDKIPSNFGDIPENLPPFNDKTAYDYVEANGFPAIEIMGYIPFGTNNVLFIFGHAANDAVSWLMQSKLHLALGKDNTVQNHLADPNYNLLKNKKGVARGTKGRRVPEDDKRSISDGCHSEDENEGGFEVPDSDMPVQSRETPDPGYPTFRNTSNRNTSNLHKMRFEDRDISGSPDARKRTGLTPGPLAHGAIVYGREYWNDLRGFVYRGEACEIEVLDTCPVDRLSPNKNTSSLGPVADKDFLENFKRDKKLISSKVEIVGCAAKWGSKSRSTAHIYVLFEIKDDSLRKQLNNLRKAEGEDYQGPAICSYSTFKQHVRTDRKDLDLMAALLRRSQFAKDALAEAKFDVAEKIDGKNAGGKPANKANKKVEDNLQMASFQRQLDQLTDAVKTLVVQLESGVD